MHNLKVPNGGPSNISELRFHRASKLRETLFKVYVVATLGLGYLLMRWLPRLQKYLYVPAYLDNCDRVEVVNHLGTKSEFHHLYEGVFRLSPIRPEKKYRYFFYGEVLFYFSKRKQTFCSLGPVFLNDLEKSPEHFAKGTEGLTKRDVKWLVRHFRQNVIDCQVESAVSLAIREITTPFSIFQIFSLVVWMLDGYQAYAMLILIMMMGSIGFTVHEIQTQQRKIRSMTYANYAVSALRKSENPSKAEDVDKAPQVVEMGSPQAQNFYETRSVPLVEVSMGMLNPKSPDTSSLANVPYEWGKNDRKIISSMDLMVGDLVMLSVGQVIPADILLINGKCLVDESILTGETVPVPKVKADAGVATSSNNIVYSGTLCLTSKMCVGVVIKIGYYTKKGETVRNLLFAEATEFQFKRDAYLFLAGILAITSLMFVWFLVEIAYGQYSEYYRGRILIIKGLEMFTVSVPPSLPLCLSIGLGIASRRLFNRRIYNKVLEKINEAGRIRLMCFDKTGTLTESSLNLIGIMPVEQLQSASKDGRFDSHSSDLRLESVFKDLQSIEKSNLVTEKRKKMVAQIAACCHSLCVLNEEIVGDQMEIQFFRQTGFNIAEGDKVDFITFLKPNSLNQIERMPRRLSLDQADTRTNPKVFKILKRFDFTPERRRMSVVAQEEKTGNVAVLVKGAPEVVCRLCNPNSLPQNFAEKLAEYTNEGLRVLAAAYRRLNFEHETKTTAQEFEVDLQFLCFLIFENPLKRETVGVIRALESCKVKSVMITGDNLMTAVSVGIKSKFLDSLMNIYMAQFDNGRLTWTPVIRHPSPQSFREGDQRLLQKLEEDGFRGFKDTLPELTMEILENSAQKNCCVAMTGEVFDMFFHQELPSTPEWIVRSVLPVCTVFGRTNPTQKARIVAIFQDYYKTNFRQVWLVGFCGDGANDCEALKQADVGLSISETEASIAAPFNTSIKNISPLITLMIEGKASLESALQNFRFIIFYSIVQFLGLIACYSRAVEWSNGSYYYMDMFCMLPLSVFLTYGKPITTLNHKFPKISLLEVDTIASIGGHLILAFVAVFLFREATRLYPERLAISEMTDDDEIVADNNFFIEPTAYLFYACISYSVNAIIFSRSFPFKQGWWNNLYLCTWVVVCVALTTKLILFPGSEDGWEGYVRSWMRINLIDPNYTYLFVVWSVLFSFLGFAFEKVAMKKLLDIWKERKRAKKTSLVGTRILERMK